MVGFVLIGLSSTTKVGAGGFEGPGIGSRATGMGGAFIGLADDWTAIYWNPAGLAQHSRATAGMSLEILQARFHDSSGLRNATLPFTEANALRGDVFSQLGNEPSQFSGTDSSFVYPLPSVGG